MTLAAITAGSITALSSRADSIITDSTTQGSLPAVLVLSLQVAALAGLVLVLEATVLRRSPVWLRELLWLGVLARFLLPVEWGSAAWLGGGLPLGELLPVPELVPETVAPSPASTPIPNTPPGSEALWSLLRWTGVILFALCGLLRHRREIGRLAEQAGPVEGAWRGAARRVAARLGLTRSPRLRASSAAFAPCVVGILRPVVWVPVHVSFDDVDEAAREHVLLHEFAHARRRDGLRAAVVVVVQVLFWFHPVAWLAARRLAVLRELGADRCAATRAAGGATAYGRTLLAWSAAPTRSFAIAGWMGRPTLRARIEELVRRPAGRARRWVAVLAAIGLPSVSQIALAVPVDGAPMAAMGRTVVAAPTPPRATGARAVAGAAADPRELPGCLQRRYLVFQALAAERRRAPR